MSQIDSITLGESVSVVSPCDEALCVAVKDIVWQAALSESGAHSGVKKLTVGMPYVRRLRICCAMSESYSQNSNFDFWNNIYWKRKSNSNFPH